MKQIFEKRGIRELQSRCLVYTVTLIKRPEGFLAIKVDGDGLSGSLNPRSGTCVSYYSSSGKEICFGGHRFIFF